MKIKTISFAALVVCAVMPAAVFANQEPGDAPFINTWLVAGPYEKPAADVAYKAEIPANTNIALKVAAKVSSSYPGDTNLAGQANDGSMQCWVSAQNDMTPWVSLEWDALRTVRCVTLAQWGDGRHVNQWYHLTFTLGDGSKLPEIKVASTSDDRQQPTVYTAPAPVKNVKSVLVEVDKGRTPYPGITGLAEIEVYEFPLNEEPAVAATPNACVTPVTGADFEGKKWEYFDDRLWNRNYDDYQDLQGYYTVKQGIDTRNQYICAHTYVYSPKAQAVQFRVGSSGSNRLFVNDIPVSKPSVPCEVQKDLVKRDIQLKQGWNKLMVQLKHTFTEDLNGNGVPIAKDHHVAFLGFYGRVCDRDGNTVPSLEYSVSGDTVKAISIVTRGLTAAAKGNKLPANRLPAGYALWPYVWNKSTTQNRYGVSASPFRFEAAGGTPGYTWSLVDSKLPDGLTLNPDGTVDGFVKAAPGSYKFTVRVTDAAAHSATKAFAIEVKQNPTRFFEEGRVGALSHCIAIPRFFVDENYSADLWAERARREGHSLVSIESLQQNYYWPSKFADPKHPRNMYLPKDADGKIPDGLKPFEEAAKRYGIKFGLYYATEGGGLSHHSTDVFFQNVADLIQRYNPDYLFFDGPQAMRWANYDVMFSNVRNYSDAIIINSNSNPGWGGEFGDPDLRTTESSHIYSGGYVPGLIKRTIMEPWRSAHTVNNRTPYYGTRDDYRQIIKEMVASAGRGHVENCDQMPLMSRGPNWDSPEDIATRYPKSIQEYITVREGTASWFAPAGKPERHEATTGTMPYFLAGCGYEDDGAGNYAQFENGQGPAWGYATARDNNLYLHLIVGPNGKKGLATVKDNTLTIAPVKGKVLRVEWLNEGTPITGFNQDGSTLTLNLAGVTEDPVDTIVKIVTDNPERKYKLTNLTITGAQKSDNALQVNVEGYMTYPALKAKLDSVSFKSSSRAVAKVDAQGLVTAGIDGDATITIAAAGEGARKTDALAVKVRNGKLFVSEELLGAALWIDGKEIYGEVPHGGTLPVRIEGRTRRGGPAGLYAAEVTYHVGIVDLKAGTKEKPIAITETNLLRVQNGRLILPKVQATTRAVVWAQVKLNGQRLTSNKVFLDIQPYENLAKMAAVTASADQEHTGCLTDGILIDGPMPDARKWSIPAQGVSWIAFDLRKESDLKNIAVHFNTRDQGYCNVPAKIEFQTSADGMTWTTVSTVNGPGGHAWFPMNHVSSSYKLDTKSRHLRLNFPEGGKGATIDLLEIAVNGDQQ